MNEEQWKRFWKWLLEESKIMKLPMKGIPTLKKYLEKKMSYYQNIKKYGF